MHLILLTQAKLAIMKPKKKLTKFQIINLVGWAIVIIISLFAFCQ